MRGTPSSGGFICLMPLLPATLTPFPKDRRISRATDFSGTKDVPLSLGTGWGECSSFHCGALNPPDGGEILVPLSQLSREADSLFENSFAPQTYFWFGFTRMAAGWGVGVFWSSWDLGGRQFPAISPRSLCRHSRPFCLTHSIPPSPSHTPYLYPWLCCCHLSLGVKEHVCASLSSKENEPWAQAEAESQRVPNSVIWTHRPGSKG